MPQKTQNTTKKRKKKRRKYIYKRRSKNYSKMLANNLPSKIVG